MHEVSLISTPIGRSPLCSCSGQNFGCPLIFSPSDWLLGQIERVKLAIHGSKCIMIYRSAGTTGRLLLNHPVKFLGTPSVLQPLPY